MNPSEITCDIHGEAYVFYAGWVDYNCTLGSYHCPACVDENMRAEEEYDQAVANTPPADPTDRAAWYARRDARLSLVATEEGDRRMAEHVALVRSMQSTFRFDHPLSV